jgi:hypothetical protein
MYMPRYDPQRQCLYFVESGLESEQPLAGRKNVFVCGALQNPEKTAALIGRSAAFAPAFIIGFHRVSEKIGDGLVPFMILSENEAEALSGVVWLDLGDDEIAKIEELELRGGLRKRITVQARVGESAVEAASYIKK